MAETKSGSRAGSKVNLNESTMPLRDDEAHEKAETPEKDAIEMKEKASTTSEGEKDDSNPEKIVRLIIYILRKYFLFVLFLLFLNFQIFLFFFYRRRARRRRLKRQTKRPRRKKRKRRKRRRRKRLKKLRKKRRKSRPHAERRLWPISLSDLTSSTATRSTSTIPSM